MNNELNDFVIFVLCASMMLLFVLFLIYAMSWGTSNCPAGHAIHNDMGFALKECRK
jgi:hypothetical protein